MLFRSSAAGAQADVGTEGEAGKEDWKVEASGEPVERGKNVVDLAAAFIVHAFAEAGSAEVEAQRGKAEVREGFGRVIDDLVVHGAAAERVRMGDERGIECVRVTGIEERFEVADGTGEVFDGLDVGTEGRHRNEFTRAGTKIVE